MSAIQSKHDPLTGGEVESHVSWGKPLEDSDGARLIELRIALAGTESRSPVPGLCSRCRSHRNPQISTAEFPNVFCSKECEQEFIRTALGSITMEDCIRIHRRLETLLLGAREPAV